MPKPTLPAVLFVFALMMINPPSSLCVWEDIAIQDVMINRIAEDKYEVTGNVINQTEQPRELVLRGQVTFYDRTAPKGDKPVMILRRDITQVLKVKESRIVKILLIDEGATEETSLRPEPMLRVRRNRIWHY